MAMKNLEDVYYDQLKDMWSACNQSADIVSEMGRHATDKDLSEALIDGVNGINEGIAMLEKLCNDHGISPSGEHCKGMEGLVKEARAHSIGTDFEDDDARDAVIITQFQRMAHYAIAGYGCLRAFANRLDFDGDGAMLQECLDGSYSGDDRMTEIATKGGINAAAV